MLRRTMVLAMVAAVGGCQGNGSTMNSAFKMPTPSFNLLAPYGAPRVPPPGTHSYGQPGVLAPTAAGPAYYPGGTNVRGVSLPQSPEAGSSPSPSPGQGNVATAVWRNARTASPQDSANPPEATLVSHQSSDAADADGSSIRIPDFESEPTQPVELRLGGMRAHDLTSAVSRDPAFSNTVVLGPAPTVIAAANVRPAPIATQVIHTSPAVTAPTVVTTVETSPVVVAPAATGATVVIPATADVAANTGLVEMADLPQAATVSNTNRSLQGVRGFETQPAANAPTYTAPASAAPTNFISTQMTVSASTTHETRDAVAAAVLESPEPIEKAAPAPAPTGWKSRYAMDES